MKKCNKCGVIKNATAEHFTRDRSKKDGLYTWCKECTRKKDRNRQAQRSEYIRNRKESDLEYKEKFKARYKRQREKTKERIRTDDDYSRYYKARSREYSAKFRKNNPDKVLIAKRKWSEENPGKVKMIWKTGYEVRKAIEKGLLVRPKKCERCGLEHKNIDAAHYDYSKPLDVKWLCRICHVEWDKKSPKLKDF